MAPTRVYPPPKTAHHDCRTCDEHFLGVAYQASGVRNYDRSFKDSEAEQLLRSYQHATTENLQRIKKLLVSHGDAICSLWGRYSEKKRKDVLTEASEQLTIPSSEPGSWAEVKNALIKWLDLDSLSQGTRLLSLLHLRTEYEPHLWAAFDTRSSYLFFCLCQGSEYSHNGKSVVMHGKHYGELKDFDVHSAHGWAEAGFPRAVITFKAQYKISNMLKGAVDQLTAHATASGNSSWTRLVSGGLDGTPGGVSWGAYHNQEFAPPTHFDPNILLEKARDHLNFLIDEVELMQTEPEYMQQYIKDVKTSTHTKLGESPARIWAHLARNISAGWTNDIAVWQRIVIEGENLQTAFARNGINAGPGTRLTKDADTAVRCFGECVRQWLMWFADKDFVCLSHLASMQKGLKKLEGNPKANYSNMEKFLDPNVQADRVLKDALTIQCFVLDNSTSGISARVDKLIGRLGCLPYSKGVARWLSGMALLDELYGSWYWRQMTDYHAPLNDAAVRLGIRSRDMMPYTFESGGKQDISFGLSTAGDIKCGQLMRALCDTPLPRGDKNLAWLAKMTEARERHHQVWKHIRIVFNDRQSSIGRSEQFITSVISQMSFDECPKYIAKIAAERQKIDQKRERDSMLGKVQPPVSFQQAWDTAANEDDAVRRTLTRKTNAARNNGTIEKDLEQLTLANNLFANDEAHHPTSAQISQIAVKEETLSVVSVMFPTGAEATSGVRWTDLVQALADAGLAVTQGAGSAVSFANESSKISIHQPHDRDGTNVDAIMLRGLGRRFNKWFGWTNETFVLREKRDATS